MGIFVRLGIALLAIVVLVIATNILMQGNTTVVRTKVRTHVIEASSNAPGPASLKTALNQFHRITLAHTENPSPASATLLLKAEMDLEAVRAAYLRDAELALEPEDLRNLKREMDSFTRLNLELRNLADQRQILRDNYYRNIEALDAYLKASLDDSFKIFGRVLAQQSLLELSRKLDDVRGHFRRLAIVGTYDKAAIDGLLASETTFLSELTNKRRGLSRSQGEQWPVQVRAEFSALIAKRGAILKIDTIRQRDVTLLAKSVQQLHALIDKGKAVATHALNATANSTGDTFAPRTTEIESTESTTDQRSKTLVAWISATVLGLLLLLAIGMVRQLDRLARHDPLTQLPNRRQLLARLRKTLKRAQRAEKRVGIFFLDLDNFKLINDSLGHDFGDRVLQGIAGRLNAAIGSRGFAAKLGGDEFTVVLRTAVQIAEISAIGTALTAAFQKPIIVDERELLVSASIGASVYPDHGADIETLLRAADTALFHAKELGRNQWTLFSSELLQSAASRFEIEQGLRRAIERDQFELVFQPEICSETREVAIVEALLRWRKPCGSVVAPGEFLDVAEQSGLITQISEWVLRTAIAAAGRWRQSGWPSVRVAINVSPRQLFDERFVDSVDRLLKEHDVAPQCIELELTENVLQTGAATIKTLRRLRECGLAIALDDFGTGYSSLASLEQLPLTRVKLDRSLIESIDTSTRSAAITHAILAMCQSLGLEVTAEGIERPQQLAALSCYPSITLQGYLLSKPLPATEILPFLPRAPQHMDDLMLSIDALDRVIEKTPTHGLIQASKVFKHY